MMASSVPFEMSAGAMAIHSIAARARFRSRGLHGRCHLPHATCLSIHRHNLFRIFPGGQIEAPETDGEPFSAAVLTMALVHDS